LTFDLSGSAHEGAPALLEGTKMATSNPQPALISITAVRLRSSAATMRDVSWPPAVGEQLPRADGASGIHEKLSAYCLNIEHKLGGAKARGFQRILGIGIADVEYLAHALRNGVLEARISDVRDNAPHGVLCEVRVLVAGLREHRDRVAGVVTTWELRHPRDCPRLVTAYVDG